MEQIRYAQEVAGRIASRSHRIHPACEDTQALAPGQILSMSACTAGSDGQPPYMAKGQSPTFPRGYLKGDATATGNKKFQKSLTLF
eukprot:11743281-Karenia_brevis.AAC.1